MRSLALTSTYHNPGLAMRFPIHRIRWDKPVGEADTIETLEKLLTQYLLRKDLTRPRTRSCSEVGLPR
jgi:hypothetical protein